MSNTTDLHKGDFAMAAHSVFISGDVMAVFQGKWMDRDEGRALVKLPDDVDVEGAESMCVIKLRRPMSIEEYREAHHPEVRPLIKEMGADIQAVLIPTELVLTIPDGL